MRGNSAAPAGSVVVTMRRPTLLDIPALSTLPAPLALRRAQLADATALAAIRLYLQLGFEPLPSSHTPLEA